MGTLYFWAYRLQIGTNRNSGRNQEVAKLGPPPNRTSIGNILAWVCTVPNVAYCVNLENSLKYPLSGPKRPILLNKIFVKNDFIIAKFSQKAEFVGFINVRCLIKSPE